jgi:hypothetical protein
LSGLLAPRSILDHRQDVVERVELSKLDRGRSPDDRGILVDRGSVLGM